jgi:hypothetical protein
MFRLTFWVLVFLLALSFFGISLEALATSPIAQANFAYLLHLLSQGWQWLVSSTL